MKRAHTPEDVEKIQSGWRKRQIQMQITMEDDDIQEYVRPWVGLTEEERKEIWNVGEKKDQAWRALLIQAIRDIEAKLKERNT
jgi:hypothetical protein